MVKGQGKKNKKPFWKKTNPELEHITNHIGKIIDNSNLSHIIDAFLYGGTAILGIQATGDIRGALIGPIGLKLASSRNEVAGLAGCGVLATLGLITIVDFGQPDSIPKPLSNGECELGYTDMINMGMHLCIRDDDVHYFQNRGWERYSDYLQRIGG